MTAKLLEVGRLTLRRSVKGGGTIFPVGKPGGARQREVWHGTRVSEACAAPFPPRLLASPSAFAGIELSAGQSLRGSKRDGRCFFDQLVLPPSLSAYMGRPPVTARELLDSGVVATDHLTSSSPVSLNDFVKTWDASSTAAAPASPHHHPLDAGRPVQATDELWPCSKVWGMGFAWSSYVAQETLLGVCTRAGLPNNVALAVGHPIPASERVFFSLATDGVMIFSRHGPGHTLAAAGRLDIAMAKAGIVKHPAKDIHDSTDLTCVGVDLVGGKWWWPPALKMWQLLLGTIGLCSSRRGSSAALRAFHGLIQWFDLLQRGKFSFYDSIYKESEAWDDWAVRDLPSDVLRELACSLALGSKWGVDMSVGHLPFIAATDASSEYGLGGCTAPRTLSSMSSLASLAERDGTYFTLQGVIDKPRTTALELLTT